MMEEAVVDPAPPKIGAMATLKSGGPYMTVLNVETYRPGGMLIHVAWFNENTLCTEQFPAVALEYQEY